LIGGGNKEWGATKRRQKKGGKGHLFARCLQSIDIGKGGEEKKKPGFEKLGWKKWCEGREKGLEKKSPGEPRFLPAGKENSVSEKERDKEKIRSAAIRQKKEHGILR